MSIHNEFPYRRDANKRNTTPPNELGVYRNPLPEHPSAIIDQSHGQDKGFGLMDKALRQWLLKNNLVGNVKWNK